MVTRELDGAARVREASRTEQTGGMTTTYRPSADDPLLILAMDHRGSFEKMFTDADSPDDAALAKMRAAKQLIYAGLSDAAPKITAGRAGVLVDEQLGADVLRSARGDADITVAMPVERSGQQLFSLEYGADTDAHLAAFDPDYVKVLVRMNPDDDPADTREQLDALAALSAALRDQGRQFLYELLVPATDAQSERAGSALAYDRDIRPELVCRVIAANQQAGVEPTLWKIEGLETAAAAAAVVAAAHADDRSADCIVLGRDAPKDRLDTWLSVAAGVPGFVGFAIGRSIWEDAVAEHLRSGDDDQLIATVSANYSHFVNTYLAAGHSRR